jgi:very-short-patch-repair endonuclease/predicted transcriptional regulator of viral defense system
VDKVEAAAESGRVDRLAAAIAARQWGVVTARQLGECGMQRTMISRRVAAGRLLRLYRGVYAFGHDRLRPEGLLLAAVLACAPRAVLSHRTAADRWGLLPTARASVDVTVEAAGGRRRRRGIHLHVVRRLDPRDMTTHHGLPITTAARTVVDVAATCPPRHAERALEQAYVQRLLAPGSLEDALSRANGRPTRVLRALMSKQRTPTITRNDLEEAFLAISRAAGLPDPEVNAPLHGYVPDFLWRAKRLVIETDGFGAHGTKRAFEHDRRRDVDLDLNGYRVRRFTHDQVMYEPAETAERLRRLYDAQ